MPNCREDSKAHWKSDQTTDKINMGSLQRIADAAEAMAQNYNILFNDLEFYKKRYREMITVKKKQDRTIAALKGQITKLKKKLVN